MKKKTFRGFLRAGACWALCFALGLGQSTAVLAAELPQAAPAAEAEENLPDQRTADAGTAIDAQNFPDPAFREYVESTFDRNGDHILSPAERDAVERISCASRGISSLEGIAFFPNLHYLYCDRNSITEIDLSGNPLVTYLSFAQNPVTSMDISACTRLETLDMASTHLAQVDFTPFPALNELTAGQQPIETLDLSSNHALAHLVVADADLYSLQVSSCPDLEALLVTGTWIPALKLGPKPQLPFLFASNNYLLTLDLRDAPVCSMVEAAGNYLMSVHGSAGVQYLAPDLSGQKTYQAAVSAGGSFDFAAVDPDFARGQVTNLSKGQLSGSLLSGISPGDTVTYTYTDGGLSVDATIHFNEGNYWTVEPAIHGWEVGDAPNAPVGESRYGTPVFTYGRAGGPFSSDPPTEAGSWVMHAEVAGTAGFGPLTAEIPFEITVQSTVPSVAPRFAVYRQVLGTLTLPDDFTWATPSSLVGDVGVHTADAIYHVPNSSETQTVPVTIVVTPKPGTECTISPITNEEQSKNIRITDGTHVLRQGTDYNLSYSVEGMTVTVVITFTGNYYGSVSRSFSFTMTNSWTVPLSIKNWAEGTLPNPPAAEARYGTPVFSYLVDGTWQSSPPVHAGQYTVRAVVAGTDYYPELSAEVSFRILSGPPQINSLSAVYGDLLASVDLPAGYTWEDPMQSVGDAGVHTFPAVYSAQNDTETGGPVQLTVTVHPKDGTLCTISPITNSYESRNIVIKDGNQTLQKSRDYFVASNVTGNTVTVVITFVGNYTGTVTRAFTFESENAWLVPLTIEGWIEGAAPNAPAADSLYGEPVFSYLVGGTWQAEPPTTAGSYTVRAEVAATDYYSALTAEMPFQIYQAAEIPENLTAVYGSTLASVTLPEGYTWTAPAAPVGSVGIRTHAAQWAPADGREPQSIGLQVTVTPKSGTLCTISPVSNSHEAENLTVHDGQDLLSPGVDYIVSSAVNGNEVTVTITFIGNYTGTVQRAYTFSFDNAWVEPLTIENWYEGQEPNAPRAAARYGRPDFTYAAADTPLDESESAPTAAGSYIVYAEVAQTPYYNGLSAQAEFEILPRPTIEAPSPVHAVYGDLLRSVALPAGYSWAESAPEYVGNAGTHSYSAVYTGADGQTQSVPVSVIVAPRSGLLCHISPITNSYEASHIVITDGGMTLVKGKDYNVSVSVSGTVVTVIITFTGNYSGSVTASYTLAAENAWVVPLSIRNWTEGTAPNAPVAEARYGTPTFSYQVGGTWQSDPPTAPGEYVVRAVVAATSFYAEIRDEVSFRILRGVPTIGDLTAVYGDILSSVDLPAGYRWDDPTQSVGDVGTRTFGASCAAADAGETGGPVQLTVTVEPKDGTLCTISPITNSYESRNIQITDGNRVLTNGQDYTVSSDVRGSLVTVTIRFMGNYKGTAMRSFTFGSENSWIVPLSIESWFAGESPNAPVADAAYGEPVFDYLVGSSWQAAPPGEPGTYAVRATVPAGEYYAEISMQVPFRIYAEPASAPQDLSATYGDLLASVALPSGFAWENPEDPVGNAGVRTHAASYTAEDGTAEDIGLRITVSPKNGALCTISPVTDSYEARRIVVQDGSTTLQEGTDYLVTAAVDANVVTVTIHFIGNYYGTVTRSYTFTLRNVWIEPLTLEGWTEGDSPNLPNAHARYGTTHYSFAAAADPLTVSRSMPTAAGDYIVYADVPASPYYNGLSAHLQFRIAPRQAADQPQLTASSDYSVSLETVSGTGKVLTGLALMITQDGHTVRQVLPMAEAVPDASGTVKNIVDASGTVLQEEDIVGTGCIMQLVAAENATEIYDTAVIAVLGDVLGSGRMNIAQIVAMAGSIMGTRHLSGVYELAGDFNSNGKIDIADLVKAALILRSEEI
ncbi:MAG: hypothetical protein HDQ87_08975 [Clostridia bacterium]|nr:hypothetical protein [Clostridia bacterium]